MTTPPSVPFARPRPAKTTNHTGGNEHTHTPYQATDADLDTWATDRPVTPEGHPLATQAEVDLWRERHARANTVARELAAKMKNLETIIQETQRAGYRLVGQFEGRGSQHAVYASLCATTFAYPPDRITDRSTWQTEDLLVPLSEIRRALNLDE